jgi:hypothetical protein
MRAPDDRTRRRHLGYTNGYTDEQWQAIKQSLTRVGVADPRASRFRDELEGGARDFALRSRLRHTATRQRPPTAKQQAAEIRKELAKIDTTLATLSGLVTSYDFFRPELSEDQRRRAGRKLHGPFKLLMAERTKLRQQLDELLTPPSNGHLPRSRSGNRNAAQIFTEFWRYLMQLWNKIVPNAAARQDKELRRFLLCCSRPVFPTTTDEALRGFIGRERRLRKQTSFCPPE